MGLDAIGDQIGLLTSSGAPLDTHDGKLLCEYVKAACSVSKNGREAEMMEKVAELSDADLERLLTDEVQHNPELLRRIIERAKVDLGRIS